MRIHVLGICGTFMGSLAILARQLGLEVSGSDENVYPPMSIQLEQQGIPVHVGYDAAALDSSPDLVVIGNALTRGNPAVEAVLDRGLRYCSGPEWLARELIDGRHVIAVAGTHGKTTTTSMIAWLLECAGESPGFLIGGVPRNFDVSARLGSGRHFVVEADEYDTAFFDKRSKFVHYRPRTLVMNNLEFDHADIFDDLGQIQTQFHHLVRTVPATGLILSPEREAALSEVLDRGCWSRQAEVHGVLENRRTAAPESGWWGRMLSPDGSEFEVGYGGDAHGRVQWPHCGRHNVANALMAIAAVADLGVDPAEAARFMGEFAGVKRRLEVFGRFNDLTLYDDFAHHPTAIASTLQGLRRRVGNESVLVILEPASNTMKRGIHRAQLPASWAAADAVYWYQPEGISWVPDAAQNGVPVVGFAAVEDIVQRVVGERRRWRHVVVMSNGGFGGLHAKLADALAPLA